MYAYIKVLLLKWQHNTGLRYKRMRLMALYSLLTLHKYISAGTHSDARINVFIYKIRAYEYIYIYIHTHIHTNTQLRQSSRAQLGHC